MIDNRKANGITPDCASFQEKLPSLFESEEDKSTQPHLQTCENCRALVADLQYIADQAKIMLPLHDPSPEVWNRVQNAIKKEPSRAK